MGVACEAELDAQRRCPGERVGVVREQDVGNIPADQSFNTAQHGGGLARACTLTLVVDADQIEAPAAPGQFRTLLPQHLHDQVAAGPLHRAIEQLIGGIHTRNYDLTRSALMEVASTRQSYSQSVSGVQADVKRVPELVPAEVAENSGYQSEPSVPVAKVSELAEYDAIIFGTPTRYGRMSSQMASFWDQTGGHWVKGSLIGKVASVFTSTATGGGSETTITSTWVTLAHQGFVIVGLPYSAPELTDISELRGGGPYGAATMAGSDNSRQPSEKELSLARFQGRHVAEIATRLHG